MEQNIGEELKEIRAFLDEKVEYYKAHPLMSDEEILQLIDRYDHAKAVRRRNRWVAAAAVLLLGVCVTAFYFRQDALNDNMIAKNSAQEELQSSTLLSEGPSTTAITNAQDVSSQPSVVSEAQSLERPVAKTSETRRARKKASTSYTSAKVDVAATEVTCNSSCDSSAVLGQIRSFLMNKEV